MINDYTNPKRYYTLNLKDMGKELEKDFALIVIGSFNQLKAKIIEHQPNLHEQVEHIFVNSLYSSVEKFYYVNQLLPKIKQFILIPVSSPTDSYIRFSEQSLFDLLFETDDVTRDLLNNKGSLLHHLFGNPLFRCNYLTLQEHMDGQEGDLVLWNSIITNGLELSVLFIDKSSGPSAVLSPGQEKLWKTSQFTEVKHLPPNEIPNLVLGIDFGKTFTVGANAKGFPDNEIRNLVIKKRR